MKRILWILPLLVLIGCTIKIEPLETGSDGQVTNDNVFTYGPAVIKVNPDFEYFKTSERLKLLAEGISDTNTKKEYHMFAGPNLKKGVVILTQTIRNPHTHWRPHTDLMKNVAAIEKKQIKIEGKTYHCSVRAFSRFPEPMLVAIRERGINVEKFQCGLENGACSVLTRYKLMCVYYVEGLDDCTGLSNNSNLISDKQKRIIQEFINRFDENITITHK